MPQARGGDGSAASARRTRLSAFLEIDGHAARPAQNINF